MFGQRTRVKESIVARVTRLAVQLIGVIVFGFIIIGGVLVWRLTAGPVSLTFLTPYFEKALSTHGGSYRTVLQDTILKRFGGKRVLDLQLRGAQIIGPGDKLFAEIPELSVSLSAGALMQGRIAAKSLSISGPKFSIIRKIDGSFGLDLPNGGHSGEVFVTNLLSEIFRSSDERSLLAQLSQVEILNASVTLDDRQLDTIWQAPKANIILKRVQNGLAGVAEINLKLGAKLAKITIDASFNAPDRGISLTVGFSDIIPSSLSNISRQFLQLKYMEVPVSGTFSTKIFLNGATELVDFDVKADKGTVKFISPLKLTLSLENARLRGSYDQAQSLLSIERFDLSLGPNGELNLPKPINHNLPLKNISIVAKYLFDKKKLELEEILADLAGPTINSRGVFQEIAGQVSFALSGDVRGMKFDTIGNYWPKSLKPETRMWVTENLSVGTIPVARVEVSGRWSKGIGARIDSLIGDMALRNLTVDYFPPMPKATGANGSAKFDKEMFEVEFDEADAGGLAFHDWRILFRGLGGINQYSDIQLRIDGSVKSTLDLISGKPLEFDKSINIKTYNLAGTGSTEVKLNFIVKKSLTPNQVTFSADSILRDVSISNIAFGKTMTHGDLVLSANNRGLKVWGKARLDDIPVKLKWRKNFDADPEADYETYYELSGNLSAKRFRERLNFNVRLFEKKYVSGDLKFDVTMGIKSDGQGSVNAVIDLKGARMSLPQFGWRKSKLMEAKARLSANITAAGIDVMPIVEFIGGGMTLIGNAEFTNSEFNKFNFSRWEFGKTKVSGSFLRESEGWRIYLRGPKLDLVSFLDSNDQEDSRYFRGPPLSINLNVGRVKIFPGKFLRNVYGELGNDGLVWTDIKISSIVDDKKSLVIKLSSKEGKRYLYVASDNAGAVLQTFGLYRDIVGGKLALKAEFQSMSPNSKVVGKGVIENFRLVDAPLLARLLGIASITGIPDELAGAGLSFQRFDVPFIKENGMVELKGAKAGGLNLGITVSGTLDLESETLDIKGSIAPLDKVNSLFGNIPLFGVLFSGGEKGGGLFAAEYSMVGPIDDPKITTNPLTALTPGIFRKVFEILPGANPKGGVPDWPDPDDPN